MDNKDSRARVVAEVGALLNPEHRGEHPEITESTRDTEPETDQLDAPSGAQPPGVPADGCRAVEDDSDERLVDVMKAFADFRIDERRKLCRMITRTGDQAILLDRVLYWFSPSKKGGKLRAKVFKRGKRWMFKTDKDFAEETGMSPRQVRRSKKTLEADGYIECQIFRAYGHGVTHVRPRIHKISQAIESAYSNSE